MLELAYQNRDALRRIYLEEIMKEKNKYYYFSNYFEYEMPIEPSEWRRIQYVSKNEAGQILAYFGAVVNRQFHIIEQLELINLKGQEDVTATRDFIDFVKLLLCQRKFRKIIVQVVKENPAMKLFDKFIIDGRLGAFVGVYKNHCVMTDGNCYDQYVYEIYRENFEQSAYCRK